MFSIVQIVLKLTQLLHSEHKRVASSPQCFFFTKININQFDSLPIFTRYEIWITFGSSINLNLYSEDTYVFYLSEYSNNMLSFLEAVQECFKIILNNYLSMPAAKLNLWAF